MAAFVNGILVRYQDYNDTYLRHGLCHPSDMFAAVLAATQVAGGSGRDLILGMALAYEVFCGMVDANAQATGLGRSGGGGFDQATFGVMGAAVAAARLLGLDRAQITHALSMAVASHITLSNAPGHLSHWKGVVPNAGLQRRRLPALLAARPDRTGGSFAGPGGFFTVAGAPLASPPLGGRDGDYRILSDHHEARAGRLHVRHRRRGGGPGPRPDSRLPGRGTRRRCGGTPTGAGYGAGDFAWQPRTRETAPITACRTWWR
ncbi:MAG: MmgE/PrpD family protein [Dehalococcoidia bacterium]